MKNTKKLLTAMAVIIISIGMVSCGDKASSAEEAEVKVDGGGNASIADSKEEIKDSVAVTEDSSETETDSEVVVKSNSNREHEYKSKAMYPDKVRYEMDQTYYKDWDQTEYAYSYLFYDQKAYFSTINGVHLNNSEIVFDTENSTEWLIQIKPFLMEELMNSTSYRRTLIADRESDFLIIDSEEEVEVNGRKFVKFTAHFDCASGMPLTSETTDGPINCIGYITVIQDERSADLVEPDVVGWFVCEPADTADLVFMEENVKHAAETLTIEE